MLCPNTRLRMRIYIYTKTASIFAQINSYLLNSKVFNLNVWVFKCEIIVKSAKPFVFFDI